MREEFVIDARVSGMGCKLRPVWACFGTAHLATHADTR